MVFVSQSNTCSYNIDLQVLKWYPAYLITIGCSPKGPDRTFDLCSFAFPQCRLQSAVWRLRARASGSMLTSCQAPTDAMSLAPSQRKILSRRWNTGPPVCQWVSWRNFAGKWQNSVVRGMPKIYRGVWRSFFWNKCGIELSQSVALCRAGFLL